MKKEKMSSWILTSEMGVPPVINVMIGPPGSGKTTFAEGVMKLNPELVRISKDMLRDQLRASYTTNNEINTEPLVNSIYDAMIEKAIDRGFSVVLDTTNCDYKVLAKRLEYYIQLAEVNLVFMEDLPMETLIARNDTRTKKVPVEVIKSMSNKYRNLLTKKDKLLEICKKRVAFTQQVSPEYDINLPDAVIIDLDDTVALKSDRGPYEWKRVGEDSPIKDMIRLINNLEPSTVRIFLTGRSSECFEETNTWIKQHFIFNQGDDTYAPILVMRDKKDFRAAPETKAELYENHVRGKYNVITVFDDDTRAVQMYRRKGLHTLLCKR